MSDSAETPREVLGPAARVARQTARRLSVHVQDEVAGTLARRIGTVPERRIEELLHSPFSRLALDGLFWGLPRILTGSRAHELTRSVRFQVLGRAGEAPDVYGIEFRDGRWHAAPAAASRAQLTITATAADLVALACGRAQPVRHIARGRLRIRGNPIAAAKLLALIRVQLAPAPGLAASPPPAGGDEFRRLLRSKPTQRP